MNISDLIQEHYKGNRAAFARAAGVTRQAVKQWDGSSDLKPEYVIPVCKDLKWLVTPNDLCPAIYPHRTDGLPKKAA